jgi:hypothetical protein
MRYKRKTSRDNSSENIGISFILIDFIYIKFIFLRKKIFNLLFTFNFFNSYLITI